MKAFESFVAVALEADGFVVSSAVKFNVTLKTKKAAYDEFQSHGYQVDLIGGASRLSGACHGEVVLRLPRRRRGPRHGPDDERALEEALRAAEQRGYPPEVVEGASDRYGYAIDQVELRLYVGRFAAPTKGTHENAIRTWASQEVVGVGPIKVFGLWEIVGAVRDAAERKQYRDDPVLVTLKVLQAAGQLRNA